MYKPTLPIIFLFLLLGYSCDVSQPDPFDDPLFDPDPNLDFIESERESFAQNPDSMGFLVLEGVYEALARGMVQGGPWVLEEGTSDIAVPLKIGENWDSRGYWESYSSHEFTSDHPGIWQGWEELSYCKIGIDLSHKIFDEAISSQEAIWIKAERDFLESFIDFFFIDLFGPVPLTDVFEPENVSSTPRELATIRAIERLEMTIPKMKGKESFDGMEGLYRGTMEAAKALLARFYLNKFVFMNEGIPATADLEKVVQLCEEIIHSGKYSLVNDYWPMFSNENSSSSEASSELMLVGIPIQEKTLTNIFSLSSFSPPHFFGEGSWSYFVVVPEFFQSWDSLDPRFKGPRILEVRASQGFNSGQHFRNNGDSLKDDIGNPVFYQSDFSPPISGPYLGARALKQTPNFFSLDIDHEGGISLFPLIRLGEIFLMKAEAQLRLGLQGEALASLNQLRNTRGAKELTQIDEKTLLAEYGFELWWEGQRRTHQIRFGTFNQQLSIRPDGSEAFKKLFPIPLNALNQNPSLIQNPGY